MQLYAETSHYHTHNTQLPVLPWFEHHKQYISYPTRSLAIAASNTRALCSLCEDLCLVGGLLGGALEQAEFSGRRALYGSNLGGSGGRRLQQAAQQREEGRGGQRQSGQNDSSKNTAFYRLKITVIFTARLSRKRSTSLHPPLPPPHPSFIAIYACFFFVNDVCMFTSQTNSQHTRIYMCVIARVRLARNKNDCIFHLRKVVVISPKLILLCMSACQPAWRRSTKGVGQFSLTAGLTPSFTCHKK